MRIDYPRRARQGWRRFLPSWRQLLLLGSAGLLVVAGLFTWLYTTTDVPAPKDVAVARTSIFYYRDGTTELVRLGDVNRVPISLAAVPVPVRQAVLSAEDRSFYDNPGFDLPGIVRAALSNVRSSSTSGGSTITQQYVKNAFLTADQTLNRKAREFVISIKITRSRSKDQILEDYLNTVYFGRGAYGIEAASRAYFGTDVGRLDASRGAYLAALLQAPSTLEANPLRHRARWAYVMDGMVTQGWLTVSNRAKATFPTPVARSTASKFGGDVGYLVDLTKQDLLANGISEDDLNRGGLKVITTFDPAMEKAARAAVEKQGPTSGAA